MNECDDFCINLPPSAYRKHGLPADCEKPACAMVLKADRSPNQRRDHAWQWQYSQDQQESNFLLEGLKARFQGPCSPVEQGPLRISMGRLSVRDPDSSPPGKVRCLALPSWLDLRPKRDMSVHISRHMPRQEGTASFPVHPERSDSGVPPLASQALARVCIQPSRPGLHETESSLAYALVVAGDHVCRSILAEWMVADPISQAHRRRALLQAKKQIRLWRFPL